MAKQDRSGNSASGGNDSIADLVRLAGPRPDVPPHVQQRVREAVHAEWRNTVKRRWTLQWGLPLALAATVILGIALSSRSPETSVSPVATVTLIDGGEKLPSGLAIGDYVYPGEAIATGDSGLALSTSDGLVLRFDAGTQATFHSADDLVLDAGRIYADTGMAVYGGPSITIRTGVGSATDIGTLFSVAHHDDDMRVAVREGRVDVSGTAGSYTAEAGDLLIIRQDDVSFDELPPYDRSWQWAEALAPSFDIENRTLLDFLKWAARETGKELEFENQEARIAAMGTRLHGSVSRLTPSEAVESVLPTTKFEYRIEQRRIVIGGVVQ